MDISATHIIPGQILPDGTLQLTLPSPLPPGPVRVTVERVATLSPPTPDVFIDDPCISVPFDLPLPSALQRNFPTRLESYPLPEAHDVDESMS